MVQNLERVLDLELPPPPMESDAAAGDADQYQVDCGICYRLVFCAWAEVSGKF